jgi:hypothetical protein
MMEKLRISFIGAQGRHAQSGGRARQNPRL